VQGALRSPAADKDHPAALPLPRERVAWPALGSLGLSPAAIAERIDSIGGSDANTILSGSGERILRRWREKRGEVDAEDLSDKLPVMLGSWTEAFNRQWYQKLVGHEVTRVGERLRCPVRAWRTADAKPTAPDLARSSAKSARGPKARAIQPPPARATAAAGVPAGVLEHG
jgi:hypothetical protein